jgi:hypothetical protein
MGGVPRVGSRFAGYRIEGTLGRGGAGVVFLALDPRLQRRVALKVLADDVSQDESVRARFAREPRIAASIDHPNIIPIYEAGESEGRLYIAMRHVEGCDLGVLVRREGPLDAERAIGIIAQVAGALDAAHARGLFHRDIKPGNILVVPRADRDSSDHAYLADFGITKTSETRSLTKTGTYLGTLDYAAPEQIRGEPVDARTDIYALGCVLYQSLTGVVPFAKDNDAARVYAHLSEDPPALSARRPDLPPALDAVVAKAMAKDPDQRYATGAALASAARRALQPSRARRAATKTDRARTVTAVRSLPVAPSAVAPTEIAAHPAVPAPPRSQRLVIGGAGVLIAISFLGLLTHHSTLQAVPASTGATGSPSAAAQGTYPTAQESALLKRFPSFVENCHRYSPFAKAVAGIECGIAADFPGATTLVYQQFANYGDLEDFFHRERFLPPTEQGKPTPNGLCVDAGPSFRAYSNYNTDREAQPEPTAHGHLFCYLLDGVPKLAWTNVGQLVVARAVGSVSDPQSQSRLLDFWTDAGPVGTPDAPPGTPESQVRLLYERYLEREPETASALRFWVGRLATDGFAQVSNEIADSSEARTRFTLPLLHPAVTPPAALP